MGAGQFNSLIDILKPTDVTDTNTGEVTTTYPVKHRNVPAKKEDASGGSTQRGRQVEERVKSVLTIGFLEDVQPSWRVKVTSENGEPTLEIAAVLDRDDRRRERELHCSDVK